MKRYNYYLPFAVSADVNYIFILKLYRLKAEYNYKTKLFEKIQFKNLKELSERLNISYDTLNRERKNEENKLFFALDTKGKTIELNSNFKNSNKPFIKLTDREVSFLLERNDNLLCKYLIYLKYYCSKAEGTFTQEQFLSAIGYCSKSGKNKNKLSEYNKILVENGFLFVLTRFSEQESKRRNRYKYISE